MVGRDAIFGIFHLNPLTGHKKITINSGVLMFYLWLHGIPTVTFPAHLFAHTRARYA